MVPAIRGIVLAPTRQFRQSGDCGEVFPKMGVHE